MIAILDYEAGNLTSVELAVRHVGGEALVTQNPGDVKKADRIIFPGVGSAAACMDNLRRLGLDQSLAEAVERRVPILAICIGMQLIFEHSAEDGGVPCLGLLPGTVERFDFPKERHVKIPHMGWNSVIPTRPHPLLAGLPTDGECYFVHSYFAATPLGDQVFATTDYEGQFFCSAAGHSSLFATQFHPEKSGKIGLRILENFLTWDGSDTC